MTFAEIMAARMRGKLTDAEALAELRRIGKSEAEARNALALQDALFTEDNIEVDGCDFPN